MDATATLHPAAALIGLGIVVAWACSIGATGCVIGELIRRRWLLRDMPGRSVYRWAIMLGILIPLGNGLLATILSSDNPGQYTLFEAGSMAVIVIAGVATYAFGWLLVYRWLVYIGVKFPRDS